MLPLIPIIAGLAQIVPSIIGLLAGDEAEKHAEAVAGIATAITGQGTPEQAVSMIKADPEAQLKFQAVYLTYEAEIYREETKRLEAVNETMRAESKSERWPQYSWRPFNGFSFPVAVMGIYLLLPILGKTVPSVPEMVWVGWLAILGVATWDRGKEKRVKAGESKPGLLQGVIEAIKGGSANG
uniref:Putative holin n=1 Tax=viral metagenome TaxID=1070528 RepID=A0A6M3ITU9_9ZZZZ